MDIKLVVIQVQSKHILPPELLFCGEANLTPLQKMLHY
jgi:hypothetical protein